jgi:hypothetical protein
MTRMAMVTIMTTTTITSTDRRAVSRAPHSRRRCRSLD